MKKLNLADLRVESFEIPQIGGRGTIQAHSYETCATCPDSGPCGCPPKNTREHQCSHYCTGWSDCC